MEQPEERLRTGPREAQPEKSHGSNHRSNHRSKSNYIVVPGDNLTTGSGHNWRETSYYDSQTRGGE